MGKFGYYVIDADGHGGDPANWWERLPEQFKPKWEERRARVKSHFANLPGVGVKETRGTAKLDMTERPGMSDPVARLADMDLEGIDEVVCFPGGAGEEWAGLDRDFAMALCRTMNDARATYMRHAPSRLKSLAKLPLMHAFTHPVGQMMAVMSFTVGGILHRFPKLRVAFMEANTGWLPFWLHRLDEHWELTPEQAPLIDRKPSEYFLSGRCFIGSDPGEPDVSYVVNRLGEGVVVYASDYYHWDCAFPDTVKIVAERSDLSKSAKKAMFEDNPRRLYAL
jgi:predicted TIM-barrel fold metal-dependent hydrolase